MLQAFLMGMAYGVGGTAFNISIRYIGFSLTYAIAVGLSALTKTVAMPLIQRHAPRDPGEERLELDRRRRGRRHPGHRPLRRRGPAQGTRFPRQLGRQANSICSRASSFRSLAGVLSAVYGIAMEDVAKPIVDLADEHGAGNWKGNIAYPFVNSGAFVTALLYSLYLAREIERSASRRDWPPGSGGSLGGNYLLAMLTGTLWYGQFFFYNLGHVRMSNANTSWAIHMIMLVLFSNSWRSSSANGKAAAPGPALTIALGLAVLIAAVLA